VVRARELGQNGGQLYRDGSYDAAIDAFEAAYELVSDPNLLYNISLAHEKAGRLEDAAQALDRYRAFAPAPERDALKARSAELRDRARSEAGSAPSEVGTIETGSGDSAVPPSTEQDPTFAGEADADPVSGADSSTAPPLMGPVGWGLVGLGVAALGAGVGLGIASVNQRDEAKAHCEADVSTPLCLSTASDALDASRKLALGADISYAVSGAAALGAVAWVVVRTKKRRAADRGVALVPGLSPGFSGAALVGRF
jgi:tetratricopeptide (TPR) repeat protein